MDMLLDYLRETNKPITLNNICNAFADIHKLEIKQQIEILVSHGVIHEQKYKKKASLYSLTKLDPEIKQTDTELNDYNSEINPEETLENINDLKKRIDECANEIKSLQEKTRCCTNTDLIDKQDKILADYARYVKEYKKRKSICTDVIDSIFENYPKSKQELLDELQVETDEDVGFSLSIQKQI